MKIFVSIGSGPGIGFATAERFAAEGYHVVLSSRNPVGLSPLGERLRQQNNRYDLLPVDASDAASIRSLINEVIHRYGHIDVLHYNAASLRKATIATQPGESFVSDLSVNVAGAMLAIQAVSPSMFSRGRGSILLTGGGFAVAPSSDYISLSVGKAGIRALALGLFEDYKRAGVHVATITASSGGVNNEPWSRGVAEAFWEVYKSAPDQWLPERAYP